MQHDAERSASGRLFYVRGLAKRTITVTIRNHAVNTGKPSDLVEVYICLTTLSWVEICNKCWGTDSAQSAESAENFFKPSPIFRLWGNAHLLYICVVTNPI